MLMFKELWRRLTGKEDRADAPVIVLEPQPDTLPKVTYVCIFPGTSSFGKPVFCMQCGQAQGQQNRAICKKTYEERQIVTLYQAGSLPRERWEEAALLIRSGVKPFE